MKLQAIRDAAWHWKIVELYVLLLPNKAVPTNEDSSAVTQQHSSITNDPPRVGSPEIGHELHMSFGVFCPSGIHKRDRDEPECG